MTLIAGTACLAPLAWSQSEADDDGSVYTMSPFEVDGSKDQGYRAANTISGTRTNTPIIDLPINIQVITGEFMEDIGASYATEALEFSPSVNPGNVSRGEVAVRGFRARWNLRNGFRTEHQTPAFNTERVEVIKGPASVIYGITPPGGTFNIITKQARAGADFYHVETGVGLVGELENTEWNAGIDANVSFANDSAAVRVVAERRQYPEHWEFSEENTQWTFAPSLEYRLTEKTTFQYQYERHFIHYITGSRSPKKNGPGGSSIPVQYLMSPEDPQWHFQFLGPNSFQHRYSRNHSFIVRHAFNEDLEVMLNYARAADRVSFNQHNISLRTDPETNEDAIRMSRGGYTADNALKNFTFTTNYKFDFDSTPLGPVSNTLMFNFQKNNEFGTSYESTVLNSEGKTKYVWYPLSRNIDIDGPWVGDERVVTWRNDSGSTRKYDSYTAVWQGKFAEQRFLTNFGFQYIDIERIRHGRPEDDYQADQVSPLLGVVYRPAEWLSLFAMYAESLFPDPRKDGFDNPIDPVSGRGSEAGAKFQTNNGRISGTVSFFEIDNVGEPKYIDTAPNKDTEETGETGAWVPIGKSTSRGYEAEFIFTPIDPWQIVFGYGYHDAIVAVNPAEPEQVGQNATFDDFDHKWSLWTRYEVPEGRFKGVSIGAGGYRVDHLDEGWYQNKYPRETYPGWEGKLMFGYSGKTERLSYRVALNIDNVFDRDSYTGWMPVEDGAVAMVPYSYKQGRDYSLSFSCEF